MTSQEYTKAGVGSLELTFFLELANDDETKLSGSLSAMHKVGEEISDGQR